MPLTVAHSIHGGTTVIGRNPRCEVHEDVLVVPYGIPGATPGLFDRAGRLITAGAAFRGVPHLHLIGTEYTSSIDPTSVSKFADRDDMVFCGVMHGHYGHYLVGSLCRYWWITVGEALAGRCLILNAAPPETLLKIPFIRDTLSPLGISADSIVCFREPVRIRRLVVPAAAFEENLLVHRTFARLCNHIGRLVAPPVDKRSDRLVYVSKARIKAGVSRIGNEDAFVSCLQDAGVSIVYPEELTFAEQVKVFRDHRVVAGTIGSALHTSVFVPGCKLFILNHGNQVWSNQILIDRSNDNSSLYLHAEGDMELRPASPAFGNECRLVDPARTAAEFLRALRIFATSEGAPTDDDGDRALASLRKPATQSSILIDYARATPDDDAAGAVNGRLTGTYQFHTATEDQPWWQVDLQHAVEIGEVRVFNRLGDVAHRASRLRIMLSDDGSVWREAMRREDDALFGGADGLPLIWSPDQRETARFVRVQLLGTECLHLDQVQVWRRPRSHSLP